jgi:ubiquinone/menaquinone biosynthesis C-methylase UbiE
LNEKDESEKLLKVEELQETHRSYESEEAAFKLDAWYKIYKEESFLKYIFGRPFLKGVMLEVGGGTGFQGKVISKFVDGLYLHSDYSFLLCHSAKKKGLLSVQMDGLKLAVPDQSIDEIITIAVSTIIRSELLRRSQFNEFYRAIKPKGYLYLVTSVLYPIQGMHCIDRRDIEYLERLGFEKIKVIYWGVMPGRLWTSYTSFIFGLIEKFLSGISIGIRKSVILQKVK